MFHITEDSIKKFYEVLLLNHLKFAPIINDIFYMFFLFEEELLFMNLELRWDTKLKRLKLNQAQDKEEEKMSSLLARFRLKKKYLDKYLDERDSDSSDSSQKT